jgi:hypothetical protein
VGTLVAEVAALGLAVAFTSPVSVVTVIVLLSMPSGRRRAIAFVCGWLVAIAGIGALAVFVLHGQDFGSRSSTPSRAASALEVLLGSLIVIWGVVAYRRREPSSGGQSAPGWLSRIEGTHWLLAIAVGALMLSYGLSRGGERDPEGERQPCRCGRRDRRLCPDLDRDGGRADRCRCGLTGKGFAEAGCVEGVAAREFASLRSSC